MSFGGKEEGLPQFKKFVSEEELEEKRKKRQEEWEKVRTPEQPLEAPEEVEDTRSLYDKLEEQKMKKQDEYDEQFKLKNQVKGLDTDEAQFLDFVSSRQQQLEKDRLQEDYEVIRECRDAMVTKVSEPPLAAAIANPSKAPRPSSSQPKKSQAALLAGAVKRKGSQADGESQKRKRENSPDTASKDDSGATSDPAAESQPSAQAGRVVAILPGLGAYSDSSDSASSSSDSDIDTDLFHNKNLMKIVEHACNR